MTSLIRVGVVIKELNAKIEVLDAECRLLEKEKGELLEKLPQTPDGVDWKSLYRFQTAMRYMDNMKSLTKENAYKMADADVASLIGSAAEVKP